MIKKGPLVLLVLLLALSLFVTQIRASPMVETISEDSSAISILLILLIVWIVVTIIIFIVNPRAGRKWLVWWFEVILSIVIDVLFGKALSGSGSKSSDNNSDKPSRSGHGSNRAARGN